jgi:pimeloyl-ACP methyl ester carboxylesterase
MKLATIALLCSALAHSGEVSRLESYATTPTRFAESNGRKLAYRSVGVGDPILLCNRFRGTLDSWDPGFIDALATNFTVITFDYSGLGRSTGAQATSILEMAKDVQDLAASLQMKKIVVGGWSMGGMVAQTAAVQYQDLISHLVVIGAPPPGKPRFPADPIFLPTATKPVNDFEDSVILFFEPRSVASRQAARRSMARLERRSEDLDVPLTQAQWEGLLRGVADFHQEDRHNMLAKLKKARTPMLVLSGDREICFPVENWYALTREIQTLQLIVFPEAGHGPQHQHPEMAAEYITSFVRRVNS